MMNVVEKNTVEMACFEVNVHGRLISGNRRFCRMFGFEESEVPWHYVTDLYRHLKDWENLRTAPEGCRFEARLKNRRGRSFDCLIIREIFTNADGELCFRNVVQRKGEQVATKPLDEKSTTMVFLVKCARCSNPIRVANMGETRLRMLCGNCSALAYPEAFHQKEAMSI